MFGLLEAEKFSLLSSSLSSYNAERQRAVDSLFDDDMRAKEEEKEGLGLRWAEYDAPQTEMNDMRRALFRPEGALSLSLSLSLSLARSLTHSLSLSHSLSSGST